MMNYFLTAVLITLIILSQYVFVMRPVRLIQLFYRTQISYLLAGAAVVISLNLLGMIFHANVYLTIPIYLIAMIMMAAWQKHDFRRIYRYVILGAVWTIAMLLVLLILYLVYNDIAMDYMKEGMVLSQEKTVFLLFFMALTGYIMVLIYQLIHNKSDEVKKVVIVLLTYNFAIMIISGIFSYYVRDDHNLLVAASFLTAFLLVDYIMLFGISDYLRYLDEKNTKNAIEDSRYAYYLNMEREHLKIRKLYHEMKNYIMYFDRDSATDVKLDFNNISDQIEEVKTFYQTGNRTLDILLHESHTLAKEKGIKMNIRIEKDCLNFLSDQEINTIFINAIKNAMEASEKITKMERRIDIRAGHNLNDVLIYFKNNVEPDPDAGELKTYKEDKFVHGLGLTNVQNVAENHHGYLSVQREENTFQLTILFVNMWKDPEGGM